MSRNPTRFKDRKFNATFGGISAPGGPSQSGARNIGGVRHAHRRHAAVLAGRGVIAVALAFDDLVDDHGSLVADNDAFFNDGTRGVQRVFYSGLLFLHPEDLNWMRAKGPEMRQAVVFEKLEGVTRWVSRN
jgi:hypothetical protein